jgi:bifunctional non-homologous end joining protein LigD
MPRGSLRAYHAKRDFARTAEPKGAVGKQKTSKLHYLIQKHAARALHYDFRLEWNGVLMSWAVPKGPSEDPDDKRLAVRTEDHPLDYGSFEGTIPEGEYGGGTVMLWDTGTWAPQEPDVDAQLNKGKLAFVLHGKRLHGKWALVKLRKRSPKDKGNNWLLIKELDDYMRRGGTPSVETEKTSVKSGRTMNEIAEGKAIWHSNRKGSGAAKGDPVILAGTGKAASAKTTSTRSSGSKKKSASNPSERHPPESDPPASPRRREASGARLPARLPAFVEPQLATLVDAPPGGREWLHEIKYDGYRAVTAVAGDRVAIYTRKGLDWTDRFARLVPALQRLNCDSALLDGEIAVADSKGHTDFGALQNALSTGKGGLTYYLFDLLELDGRDMRRRPLAERKEVLRDLLRGVGAPLIYSDHVAGNGAKAFEQACAMKLEGLISKQASAPYYSGRTRSWLKSKCGFEQEFVIIGWRPSDKAGRPFSSLLLAVREGDTFRYAGRVGSGYSGEGLDRLSQQFKLLVRKTAPVPDVPPNIARRARFVEPKLVAEIIFRGWTRDGLVRQGSFKGLRSDKPAAEVVMEAPVPTRKATQSGQKAASTKASARKPSSRKTAPRKTVKSASARLRKATPHVATRPKGDTEEIAGVRITHPDRVLYPDAGITKRDVIKHYLSIADLMLPHIADRPLSLVRAPRGVGGETFYQKHASEGWPDEFKAISIREKSGADRYLYIADERGLVAAAQMSVLELHIWCSHVDEVEQPDRLVFDFDPDEGLDFVHVREAAKAMRGMLKEVGLQSFPMVTGGKGVHVVAPLRRGHSWDEHREFAEALARVMAEHDPDRFIATMSKAKRRGKIFVDYLRNQRGATAISPFSTRARKGAPVAVPVSWERLARLDSAHPVAVGDVKRFLGSRDPWPGYFKLRQGLPKLK